MNFKKMGRDVKIGMVLAVVSLVAGGSVYADSVINGPTTISSSVVSSTTFTQTVQNTLVVQPVVVSATVNDTITTTIVNTSTATINCPPADPPFC